jgi:suppressor of G2 allele of SKP1
LLLLSRYQTDSEVVVSVFIRNVKEEDLKVEIQPQSVSPLSSSSSSSFIQRTYPFLRRGQVSLSVHLPTGSDIVFDLDPLAHPIDVSKSSHRLLQPKIEIKLKKVDGGIKWNKVEGDDEGAAQKLSE